MVTSVQTTVSVNSTSCASSVYSDAALAALNMDVSAFEFRLFFIPLVRAKGLPCVAHATPVVTSVVTITTRRRSIKHA